MRAMREAKRLGERCSASGLGLEALARAGLRRERGADLAEGGLDGLLVLRDERALASLGLVGARLQAAAGEDRLGHAGGELPGDRGRAEEVGELRARDAVVAGKRDRGKHVRASDADACV